MCQPALLCIIYDHMHLPHVWCVDPSPYLACVWTAKKYQKMGSKRKFPPDAPVGCRWSKFAILRASASAWDKEPEWLSPSCLAAPSPQKMGPLERLLLVDEWWWKIFKDLWTKAWHTSIPMASTGLVLYRGTPPCLHCFGSPAPSDPWPDTQLKLDLQLMCSTCSHLIPLDDFFNVITCN